VKAHRANRGRNEPGTPAEPDKQGRILAAARSLFLRYGVRRTSMDDVAREAGIAKGTVYLYFSSKDAVFAALAEEMSRDVLAQGVEAMDTAKTDVTAFVGFLML
jgi:AcrR family transcriptional regulator